jgi:hypothetical protein
MPSTSPGSDDEIGTWLLRFMADDVADGRARMETWRQRSDETATLTGVLADIADSGRSADVHTTTGRTHSGRIEHVTDEALVIGTTIRHLVVLRPRAIAAVVPERGFRVPGEGSVSSHRSFRATIAAILEPGDDLAVIAGAMDCSGELVSIGDEVLLMRGPGNRSVYIPIGAVTEISVASSSG